MAMFLFCFCVSEIKDLPSLVFLVLNLTLSFSGKNFGLNASIHVSLLTPMLLPMTAEASLPTANTFRPLCPTVDDTPTFTHDSTSSLVFHSVTGPKNGRTKKTKTHKDMQREQANEMIRVRWSGTETKNLPVHGNNTGYFTEKKKKKLCCKSPWI